MTIAVALLLCTLGGTPVAIPAPDAYAAMSDAARREVLASLSREEQAALFKSLSPEQLVVLGMAALQALGPYEATLVKVERVRGKVLPAQTMRLGVREEPFAVRLEVVDGPAKGRKVLYNHAARPGQMRVKEGGLLGFAGGLWIDKDGALAKGDTEHSVDELGFGSVLRIIDGDVKGAARAGGFVREDPGFNGAGAYCLRTTAPRGVSGLYAQRSTLCFDPVLALPVDIEIHDAQGFREHLRYSNIKPRALGDADFQPKAFGL